MDTILDRMAAVPVILAEQHDTSRIDWEAGLADKAEMGGTGRGGTAAMIAAANRRASLDTSTGRVAVVVVGQPAWHKLGVNVASTLTAADAMRLASLDWRVEKRAMTYPGNDGTAVTAADVFALVRADTGAKLGTVGARYTPIQNADGFAFLDTLLGEFGAKFHTAGAVYGGGKVWMQCELPGHGFEVVRGDEVQAFATFTNPHDGSGKAWCFPTTNRIVCANTYRTASRDKSAGLGIRHTGDVKASIGDARRVLGVAVREIDQFREAAGVLARTPMNAPAFFSDLMDAVLDVTAAEAAKGANALAAILARDAAERELIAKAKQRQIDARRELLDDMLTRYESERCGVGGIRGTAWAAFNAVTEHADYVQPRRQMGTADERLSRRWESALTGNGDRLKQTAFELLTERVGGRPAGGLLPRVAA